MSNLNAITPGELLLEEFLAPVRLRIRPWVTEPID